MGLDIKNADLPGGTPEPTPVGDLIKDLEAAGITDQAGLQDKLQASHEAGNLANQLGETRSDLRRVQAELNDLKSGTVATPATPEPDFLGGYDTPAQPQGITLEQLELTLDRRDAAKQEAFDKAQTVNSARYKAITSEKHYPVMKAAWDKRCQDPVFIESVNAGRIDPVIAYQSMVTDFLSGVATKTLKTLKELSAPPGSTPTDHLETGDRGTQTPSLPGGGTKTDQSKLQEYQEKVNTGKTLTEDEQLDMIGKMMTDS